jgi:hypothetical protein
MDARPRTTLPTPFNLTRSRFHGWSAPKDLKNEGASGDVYENKGGHELRSVKRAAFCGKLQQLARNYGFCRRSEGGARPSHSIKVLRTSLDHRHSTACLGQPT